MIPTFGSHIPDSSDALNNVSEKEITQFPASKKGKQA
jgi:hypothetical protein